MIEEFFFYLILGFLGISVGSFITAYTFRIPRGISISKGRSRCPECKKKIAWHDNIPLLSYLLLKGKCKKCGKKISLRYPLIEAATGLIFLATFLLTSGEPQILMSSPLAIWKNILGTWSLPYFIILFSGLLAIFVTDFENKIIPDEVVFLLYALTFAVLLINYEPNLYLRLLSSFSAATFLLLLHLATFGRGMGLGDVKLALFAGIFFGWPFTLIWLFSSFIIGGITGVVLIMMRKVKFGVQIPFGPFLIVGFLLTLFLGTNFAGIFMPLS